MISVPLLLVGLLSTAGATSGAALPPRPAPPDTAANECPQAVPLVYGSPVDPSLIGPGGLVGCSAVAEPLSSYAHLLLMEKHADAIRDLYFVDVSQLQDDRDFWRKQAQEATRTAWYRSPWFVAVTSSALTAAVVLFYDQR